MEDKIIKKIIIMGEAGSGKTTLGVKISELTKIPHYSTDDFYYEVKFAKPRDKKESIDKIMEVFKKDMWLVEGTTQYLITGGFASADLVLHVTHKSIWRQFYRLARRYFQREEDTIWGTIKLMRHVLYTKYHIGYRKNKLTTKEFIKENKIKTIELTSFRDINNFFEKMQDIVQKN
jgi:adenylate kinase family enzyme